MNFLAAHRLPRVGTVGYPRVRPFPSVFGVVKKARMAGWGSGYVLKYLLGYLLSKYPNKTWRRYQLLAPQILYYPPCFNTSISTFFPSNTIQVFAMFTGSGLRLRHLNSILLLPKHLSS